MPCGGSSLQLFIGDDKKKNHVYKKKARMGTHPQEVSCK
jgi:hypothetical protein